MGRIAPKIRHGFRLNYSNFAIQKNRMIYIFRKEINAFFSSLMGYISVIVFLLVMGFFLWFYPDNNMLDDGYATMDKFFNLAPWVLLFLLPAITMRSFSDEFRSGTIEILSTLPLKEKDIVLGKFFAAWLLVVFSILPTLLYVFSLASLSAIPDNLDTGGIIGSYIGLLFLCGAFSAVGLFCSTLTNNQVIAFLIAIFINFILYSGFETLSKLEVFTGTLDYIISSIGMESHYRSISRGLIDTRDLVYFLSVIAIFILASRFSLQKRKWA